ncbi:MAG: hypothetical protein K0S19_618 [Geminicoccaceae bacterium]|nr:hypothetical protein [Geminicoccaceae bacterium]
MQLLVLAVLGAGAPPAGAQETCTQQMRFPEVGRWAEYNAVFKQNEPYTMRYAVIGEESRGGKPLKWLELRTTGNKKDGDIVYQMLVPGSVTEVGDMHEIVMKHGDKPAMKLDGMMLDMIKGQMQKQSFLSDMCRDVSLVGSEKVSVPAGEFQAGHFRSDKYGSDTWVTAEVPFSMVKSTGKDFELALLRHGKGAMSSIKEKPTPMGAPPQPK